MICFFLLPSILVLMTYTGLAQKKNNSLLWRISGNGLARPSYLFGTMHVYDNAAFNFKDSLYTFLETADALALEFDPDSANLIIEAYLDGKISRESKSKTKIDFTEDDVKTFNKKYNIKDADTAVSTNRSAIDYFISRLISSEKKQQNSMNTFMDAFLYEMARQNNKKMFGLEKLEDQIDALKYLSAGPQIKKLEKALDKWDFRGQDDPVTRLYLRENLDSIDIFFTNYFSEVALEHFLYKRNLVMASGMDSLMHQQSLFTAIGASHLPGTKGVIELLRQKGYIVDPVFSPTRIPASEYKIKQVERAVFPLKNEQWGVSYQMPGKPNFQDGEAGKAISYYYDLGKGCLYMSIFEKLTSAQTKKSAPVICSEMLNELVTSVGGKILSSKLTKIQGLDGMELIFTGGDNSYYRMNGLLRGKLFYVMSVTAKSRENLFTESSEKYINSIQFLDIAKSNWQDQTFSTDGFRISFPGNPKVEPAKISEGSATSTNTYSFFDGNTGNNYVVIVTKALPNYQLLDEATFFDTYLKDLNGKSLKDSLAITDTMLSGYRGQSFTRDMGKGRWAGLLLRRNHTNYLAVAEFEPGAGDSDAAKFISTFSIKPYSKAQWLFQKSPGEDFTAWVPAGILHESENDQIASEGDGPKNFYSYDPYTALSYAIEKEPVNEYYWAPNEDSIYARWKNKNFHPWNDSIISISTVRNGAVPGRELVLFQKFDHSYYKCRLLLNGAVMYTLRAPLTDYPEADHDNDKFFTDFIFSKEQSSASIFSNNSSKLFADLLSKDSLTFEKAFSAINKVDFSASDLQTLIEKSLLPYPENNNNYSSVNDNLLGVAGTLFENASLVAKQEMIRYIEKLYQRRDSTAEKTRFGLLGIIAKDRTATSYSLIKQLLAQKLPERGNDYSFFKELDDSLALTKSLYPDILQYAADTTMGMPIVALTKRAIDSGVMTIDEIAPWKPNFLKLGRYQLKAALKASEDDYDYDYRLTYLLPLLGMMKQPETNELLTAFLKAKPLDIKSDAALALIKNNKPVSQSVLLKIAGDRQARATFFESLRDIGKQNLFPGEFRTQLKLAESYIYQAISEEYDGESVDVKLIYIKTSEQEFNGENKRFILYRVNFPESTETENDETADTAPESYLGIAGPFSLNNQDVGINAKQNISGLYYDEKFDGYSLDIFLKKFIEKQIKWLSAP